MYNHLLYFGYWLANSAVIYLLGLVFPLNIVLGNYRFGSLESAIYSGFWLTFLVWIMWDFAISKGLNFDTKVVFFGYFFLVNSFAIWLIAKFSHYSGLGIVNYFWAFVIGLGVYFGQRIAWNIVVKKKD